MDISALSQLSGVTATGLTASEKTGNSDGTGMFKQIYTDLVDNVNQTDSTMQADIVKAAEGELDNPQQLLIDSTKSSIALQLFASVRNNVLTAYNDVTKMQV